MRQIIRKSASGRTLLAYGYDLNGNLTTQRDVTGKVTEYTYNALDLIEKVTDNGTVTAEYGYYPDGSIRSLKNGGLYTEYAFDADKNLTGLRTTLGTEVLADNHYAYDPNGNRTEKHQVSGTTRYTYDALDQLTKVQYPSYTEELYYDRAGNRTRRIAKGVEELYKYGINHNNRKKPPSVSGAQQDLFMSYKGPNTMSIHQEVARKALEIGGAPREFADAIVNFALVDMYSKGVTAPYHLPWH